MYIALFASQKPLCSPEWPRGHLFRYVSYMTAVTRGLFTTVKYILHNKYNAQVSGKSFSRFAPGCSWAWCIWNVLFLFVSYLLNWFGIFCVFSLNDVPFRQCKMGMNNQISRDNVYSLTSDCHEKVLLNSFRLNCHTLGFHIHRLKR